MLDSLFTHPRTVVAATLRAAGSVFAEEEADLLIDAALSEADRNAMIERRASGVPLEYVLGWAEFCGNRIAVDPGVFIPRRRTEFLAQQAILSAREAACARASAAGSAPVVVDLCCGTGAVGVALAAAAGTVELYAADIDPAAVRCAQRNIGAAGRVLEGDLYDALPPALRGRIDVLVANVPYVPTDAMALLAQEARLYEPPLAFDGGADGLDVLRQVAGAATPWVAPGGRVLIETSALQASAAAEIFVANGLDARVISSDELDASVVVGTRPS
ncbi:putative protein N(5)-glutamine methyltransferase [Phytoactinopolyspora mesophila]|uniref:peptide chain release factor N(5)-glutamine methyltransferase n=1 Tax=Phytoactinopolyspora mesophila TaxID=2650750 RepID=A0A7K3LYR7_9ACTN|nr:putative protein N(5)-glutamine methyltransferase [Phytoactinopolyspora mesophila]NDL56140.1 putative protein N(5)-glutamine methyltransferase [Phytoactinopolyspora mesophila]